MEDAVDINPRLGTGVLISERLDQLKRHADELVPTIGGSELSSSHKGLLNR